MTPADNARVSVLEYDVCQSSDCLRYPKAILPELGQHATVLAAIRIAAGPNQRHATFASYGKLARIGCCSLATVKRALRRDGQLIADDWVEHLGRHDRRTVTLSLTKLAVDAFEGKYIAVPRCLLLDAQERGDPFTWGERLLAGVLLDRHAMTERLNIAESLGETVFSLAKLRSLTGLSLTSILRARRRLVYRGFVNVGIDYDRHGRQQTMMTVEGDYTIRSGLVGQTAIDALRGPEAPSKPLRAKSTPSIKVTPVPLANRHRPSSELTPAPLSKCARTSSKVTLALKNSSYFSSEQRIEEPAFKNAATASVADPPKQPVSLKGGEPDGDKTAHKQVFYYEREIAKRFPGPRWPQDLKEQYNVAMQAKDYPAARKVLEAIEASGMARRA